MLSRPATSTAITLDVVIREIVIREIVVREIVVREIVICELVIRPVRRESIVRIPKKVVCRTLQNRSGTAPGGLSPAWPILR
jgi:hypothetical protein